MNNVALTSLYSQGVNPAVLSLMNLSMWWPRTGRPFPADYMASSMDGACYYLRKQPKGCRTMWLNNILMYETDYLNGADPVEQVRSGMDMSRTRRALKVLSKRLKFAKLPIDLLFCDVESTLSVFALGNELPRTILKDPKCRENLPPYLLNLQPDVFINPGDAQWAAYVKLWARFTTEFLMGSLKRLLIDSKLFEIPDTTGQITRSCVVNFGYQLQRFTVTDINGWPFVGSSIDGVSSNPGLYLYTGDGPILAEYEHETLWNRMILMVNTVRTCMGNPAWRTFPIIDAPTWRDPWVWEQVMAHCIRSGVTLNNGQWFLYWNPNRAAVEDNMAAEILGRHDQAWPRSGPLPKIPYDVDSFETNGFVTRYTDFLERAGGSTLVGSGVEGEGVTRP